MSFNLGRPLLGVVVVCWLDLHSNIMLLILRLYSAAKLYICWLLDLLYAYDNFLFYFSVFLGELTCGWRQALDWKWP